MIFAYYHRSPYNHQAPRKGLYLSLPVNISPRCTPFVPDSCVATRRNRARLFLLAVPRSQAFAYQNVQVQRVYTTNRLSKHSQSGAHSNPLFSKGTPRNYTGLEIFLV